jgi:choline monooxygenase
MSELNSAALLNKVSPALPVHWYFDPRIYELEMELLFKGGANYMGHRLMTPEQGDFHVLDWLHDGGKMLVNNPKGVELLSNVCRHRQARMLKGRGNAQHIVCPFHRWTYDTRGQLMGAPHFPDNPCLHLNKTPLADWNGLLFAGPRDIHTDLAKLGVAADMDFSGFMYESTQVTEYQFNWKTFIEVYLEDYHVVPYHPGLGQFVNCDELKWEYGEMYSVQTVGVNDHLSTPGSAVYNRWHQQVKRYREGRDPGPRRHLAHLLPGPHGGVVPPHPGGQQHHPHRRGKLPERGGVLLPGGHRPVRAGIRGSGKSRLPGNRHRG